LSKAVLTGANLIGADLKGAVLHGANLTSANLTNADLSDADLSSRNESERLGFPMPALDTDGANLRDADLTNADLSRANLKDAQGVTNEELEQQAKSLEMSGEPTREDLTRPLGVGRREPQQPVQRPWWRRVFGGAERLRSS
jgi:pentapeptide repeat protein